MDNSQKITHLLVRAPSSLATDEVRDLQDALRESLSILDILVDIGQFEPGFVRDHAIEFLCRCKGQEFIRARSDDSTQSEREAIRKAIGILENDLYVNRVGNALSVLHELDAEDA